MLGWEFFCFKGFRGFDELRKVFISALMLVVIRPATQSTPVTHAIVWKSYSFKGFD